MGNARYSTGNALVFNYCFGNSVGSGLFGKKYKPCVVTQSDGTLTVSDKGKCLEIDLGTCFGVVGKEEAIKIVGSSGKYVLRVSNVIVCNKWRSALQSWVSFLRQVPLGAVVAPPKKEEVPDDVVFGSEGFKKSQNIWEACFFTVGKKQLRYYREKQRNADDCLGYVELSSIAHVQTGVIEDSFVKDVEVEMHVVKIVLKSYKHWILGFDCEASAEMWSEKLQPPINIGMSSKSLLSSIQIMARKNARKPEVLSTDIDDIDDIDDGEREEEKELINQVTEKKDINFMVYEEPTSSQPVKKKSETQLRVVKNHRESVHDLNQHNVDSLEYKIFEAEQSGNVYLARELKRKLQTVKGEPSSEKLGRNSDFSSSFVVPSVKENELHFTMGDDVVEFEGLGGSNGSAIINSINIARMEREEQEQEEEEEEGKIENEIDEDDLPPLPPVIDYEAEDDVVAKKDLPSVGTQLQRILSAYDSEVSLVAAEDDFMQSEDLMSLNSGLVELLENDTLDVESEESLRSRLTLITRKRTATNLQRLQGVINRAIDTHVSRHESMSDKNIDAQLLRAKAALKLKNGLDCIVEQDDAEVINYRFMRELPSLPKEVPTTPIARTNYLNLKSAIASREKSRKILGSEAPATRTTRRAKDDREVFVKQPASPMPSFRQGKGAAPPLPAERMSDKERSQLRAGKQPLLMSRSHSANNMKDKSVVKPLSKSLSTEDKFERSVAARGPKQNKILRSSSDEIEPKSASSPAKPPKIPPKPSLTLKRGYKKTTRAKAKEVAAFSGEPGQGEEEDNDDRLIY